MQKLFLYICIVFGCVQCAQITPLTGGKKDTEAPKLINAIPANASLNVNTKTIELQFDEYITLKDVVNQFIITPQTKEFPDIEASGKKVKIKFNEELLPNTTYKLSFGNSIVDLRESNNLPNFEYVFSTGNTIDSLSMKGIVLNAVDLKPAAQILVGLYDKLAQDSIVYKEKPLYLIRADAQGQFSFNYLPNKKFKVVAIKDQNKNLLYDGSEELIAYSNTLIDPKDSNTVNMLLFKEIPFKSFIKRHAFVEPGKAYVIFNKPQTAIKAVKANGLIYYTQNKLKDTLSLYYTNKFDTLETFIQYEKAKTDTVYIKIPSANFKSGGRGAEIKSAKYTITTNIGTSVAYFDSLKFNLNFPVQSKNIIESKILLTEQKDTLRIPKQFKVIKKEGLITSFAVQADFLPETNYVLTLLASAVTDGASRNNDSLTYKFRTTTVDDYAQLNLKLLFPKKENYIVYLQNDKAQIVAEKIIELSLTSTAEKIIEYKNLVPGVYSVKVVEDANKNGLFDTGNYFLHTQPETIFNSSATIKLLAGWEIENEWIIK